jgi:hypothetical protein
MRFPNKTHGFLLLATVSSLLLSYCTCSSPGSTWNFRTPGRLVLSM